MPNRPRIAASASWFCALMLAATPAFAAREIGDVYAAMTPRSDAAQCDRELSADRFNACEVGLMRWRLCERVYVSRPHDDDAFFACFDGAN